MTEYDLPTLEDWLGGRVPRKTREERKADWERRTQVRQARPLAHIRTTEVYVRRLARQRLYRQVLP